MKKHSDKAKKAKKNTPFISSLALPFRIGKIYKPKDCSKSKDCNRFVKSFADFAQMILNRLADFFGDKLDFIATIPRLSFKKLARFDKKQWQNLARLNGYGLLFGLCFSAWLYAFVFIVEGLNGFRQDSSFALDAICCAMLSIFGLISVASFLFAPARIRFYFGFFAGLLLLYWIALSFRYSPFPFLIPFVWLGIGGIIGAIFWALLYFQHIVFRIFTLMILGSIHPFGFDWFIPQSFFAYSFFGVSNWDFLLLVLGVALLGIALLKSDTKAFRFLYFRKNKKSKKSHTSSVKLTIGAGFFGVLSLILALDINGLDYDKVQKSSVQKSSTQEPSAQNLAGSFDSVLLADFAQDVFLQKQIALAQTHFAQDFKWDKNALDVIRDATFGAIQSAKANAKKAIILPETILPIVLNGEHPYQIATLKKLQDYSKDFAIILGAFSKPNFNSTYVIYNGKVQILDKVILAPFGEKMPLPDFLAKPLLRLFFGIEEGLDSAKSPQDFMLLNHRFRNAICYEGTSKELYEDSPSLVVMISNNGWFYPSVEPYLQRTLMKYYARKSGAIILHSANLSPSFMMSKKVLGDSFSSVVHISLENLENEE